MSVLGDDNVHMFWYVMHRQLVEEQLPERQFQLLDFYGPNGEEPTLPAPAEYGAGSVSIVVESYYPVFIVK
eukprot:scaffold426160_cov18-Prasinocladus_malaysianus.AAC.1